MGASGRPSWFLGEYEMPKQNPRKQETYLDYVKERKEIEKLINPKKWWEYWR